MANKIKVKLILELRSAHMSRNLIASTRHMSKNSACNGKIQLSYIATWVLADTIDFVKIEKEEFNINKVLVLGPLVKDVDIRYINSTYSAVANDKYQIALNRSRIEGADYPYVSTFARQAEEDSRRLSKSSQIAIDGALITRKNLKLKVAF
jgi:single-strand DNA-binding protein